MNKVNKKIRIAVQNKGRLMEPSLEYLRSCGLKIPENGRNLVVSCEEDKVEILFVRNSDIPEYVKYGVADFGIVGRNVVMEREDDLEVVRELDFGKCSLVVGVPEDSNIESIDDLDHERVATSYPKILKKFLRGRGVSASIIEIKGSVEICPSLGLSDAIFDITQTGRTLKENGLKVIETVADSQALVIQNPNSNSNYEKIFV